MGAARVAPGGQPCGADDRGAFGAGFHGIASLCAAGGRWRDARRAHDVSSEHRHARGALGRTARFAGCPSRWVCGRAFLHAVRRSDFGFGVFLKWGGPCVAGHVALACRRAFCCVSASGCRRGGEKRCGRGWVAAIASAVCMLVGERPRSRCRPGDSAFGVPRAHGDVPVVVDGVARGCRHVLSHPGFHRVRDRFGGVDRVVGGQTRVEPELCFGVRAVRASGDVRVVLHSANFGRPVVSAHAHRGFHVQGHPVLHHDDSVSVSRKASREQRLGVSPRLLCVHDCDAGFVRWP